MSSFLIHLLILSVEISNKEGTVKREKQLFNSNFQVEQIISTEQYSCIPTEIVECNSYCTSNLKQS